MIYDSYFGRIWDKLSRVTQIYCELMFKTEGELSACEYFETAEHLRLPPADGWKPLESGKKWGGEWQNMWIRGKAVVPAAAMGKKLYIRPDTGAVEILCFRNGKPSGIINSKGSDAMNGLHSASFLTSDAECGTEFDVALECYAGHFCVGTSPYDNYGKSEPGEHDFDRVYNNVQLVTLDEDVCGFIFDLKTVLALARYTDDLNGIKAKAKNTLERVLENVVLYPLHYPEEKWRASIIAARESMAEVLKHGENGRELGYVGIIGHSHMDTAWLWPVSETIRKCARTYANALSLMEQDPDYKFIQSSALHLDWMRLYYPDIFADIVRRTAEGRYEPNGGVWVECDCNITSGELMVRQFLYGQRFTRKYMNYTSDAFWLPDTFGYNAAIPQIMRGCEVKYFYTTKMSWNDLNEFPRDTFIWRGLDGSEVITHLNIIHTFPDVENVMRAVHMIKDRPVYNGKLLTFGFGDGGGGPTAGMLEDAKRVRNLPGMPEVKYTTASEFMHDIENNSHNLAVYEGELYLELHRGTLTQMHDIKRNNRLCEIALHNMEFMDVISGRCDRDETDRLYKTLLTNQFHDILPGTSLTCVNDLARREVTSVITEANEKSISDAKTLTDGDKSCITVINPAPFARKIINTDNICGYVEGALSQCYVDITGKTVTVTAGLDIPAYGIRSYKLTDKASDAESVFKAENNTLETPFYTVVFDENGAITSLYDKIARRENVSKIPLNTFYIGEDVPRSYDDWDLDSDTAEIKLRPDMRLESRDIVADGALIYVIRSVYAIGNASHIRQDMIFSAVSRKIDFHTVIEWNEAHMFLKTGFDVAVMASAMKNEIQFGYMERPTTRNNSLEAAKFEVVNHKWTDVSESRYGVALLNDCKYGISGERDDNDGVDLRLSLHKSGTHPDVTGDKGIHELTYSLLPHDGAFSVPSVTAEAYLLNINPVAVYGSCKAEGAVAIDADNIIIEAVKPAEDDTKSVVIRLYEAERARTSCTLSFPGAKRAYITNMLEDKKSALELTDGKIKLDFKPFEIKTVLIEK